MTAVLLVAMLMSGQATRQGEFLIPPPARVVVLPPILEATAGDLAAIRELISTHPDMEARLLLAEMDSKTLIGIYVSRRVRDIEAQIVYAPNQTPVPALVANPEFLHGKEAEDPRPGQLALFIAHQELRDHFSGKWPLESFAEGSTQLLPPDQYREKYWNRAYGYKQEQWEFAKRIGAQSLLPVTSKLTGAYGERLGVLKMFCLALAQGAKPFQQVHVTHWLERCRQEEQKLQR
jgi:hypothetical protein